MLSNSVATFSLYSDLYARFRPAYPEALYQWLLPLCAAQERAWDCATGNGQTAVRLGDGFARVDATDISSAQLGQAEAHNQVYYRECPAEVTPFDDASFDLITVSQALHWFHFPSFWPEVGRVLKPGRFRRLGLSSVSGVAGGGSGRGDSDFHRRAVLVQSLPNSLGWLHDRWLSLAATGHAGTGD